MGDLAYKARIFVVIKLMMQATRRRLLLLLSPSRYVHC